jgi:hypothetical protein
MPFRQILWKEIIESIKTDLLFLLQSDRSGLGNRDELPWGLVALTTRHTFYAQKLALTSPKIGGRSVGIVRLRTKRHGVFFVSVSSIKENAADISVRDTNGGPPVRETLKLTAIVHNAA